MRFSLPIAVVLLGLIAVSVTEGCTKDTECKCKGLENPGTVRMRPGKCGDGNRCEKDIQCECAKADAKGKRKCVKAMGF